MPLVSPVVDHCALYWTACSNLKIRFAERGVGGSSPPGLPAVSGPSGVSLAPHRLGSPPVTLESAGTVAPTQAEQVRAQPKRQGRKGDDQRDDAVDEGEAEGITW